MRGVVNVAFLGTGIMGYPMAERVLKAGHDVCVYNRTAKKAAGLRKSGAKIALTPAEAIREAQCIVLMLADAKAIEETLFIKSIPLSGKTVIQMGTIAPSESIRFQKKILAKGGDYCECPVLGSIKEVVAGKLHLMFGGSRRQFVKWRKFLKAFGPEPKHIGRVGQAAALKLAMNQLIAVLASGFSLSLGLVLKSGIRVEDFMTILRKSALYAPMFDNKLPRMLKKKYTNPNFHTQHMLKDVNLFLKTAGPGHLNTAVLKEARRLLVKTIHKGYKYQDYSAVFESILL